MSSSTMSLLLVVIHLSVGGACRSTHQYAHPGNPIEQCILDKNNIRKFCSYVASDNANVLKLVKFAAKEVESSCNDTNIVLIQSAKMESINNPSTEVGLNNNPIKGWASKQFEDKQLVKGQKYHLAFIVNATKGDKCEITELQCNVVIFVPLGCNAENCLEEGVESGETICSKVQDSILEERCEYECGMEGYSAHWCFNSGRQTARDYCSKDDNDTYYGEMCSSPCFGVQTTYFWCKKTFGRSRASWDTKGWWDYCSPDGLISDIKV